MTDLIDQHQQAWREYRASQRQQRQPASEPGRAHTRRRTPRAAGSHVGNVDRLNIVKLEADLHRLSLQASRQNRHQLQAKLLASEFYADHIQRALAGHTPAGEDPVLVRCMIWAFNLLKMELAMSLARLVLQRGLAMPDDFKADARVFISREIAYWAISEQKAGRSPQPWLDEIFTQSRNWDKPDQVEARLLKAKGQAMQDEEPEKALGLYRRAYELDPSAGVTQLIKRLQKQLLE